MLRIIPEITQNDLKKILDVLPQPTSATVALFGEFSYSDLERQAGEVISGITLRPAWGSRGTNEYTIAKPAKELILKIKKHHDSKRENYSTGKGIQLMSLEWRLGDDTHILLEGMYEITVECDFNEPKYVTKLRKVLAETNIHKFSIKYFRKNSRNDVTYEKISDMPPPRKN